MKIDIDTLVSSVKDNPKPIILIDTCSILDILRVPVRPNIKISHLNGALKILQKIKSNSLYGILTETVANEYKNNLHNISVELERSIQKLVANNEKLINSIEIAGLTFDFNLKDIGEIKIVESLRKITDEFIRNCMILTKDDECVLKAQSRVEMGQPPSCKGKQESNDCLIIEHFLKIGNVLRKSSFTNNLVFISSNFHDYGDAPSIKIPLDKNFRDLNIFYCNNFDWAMKELKLYEESK